MVIIDFFKAIFDDIKAFFSAELNFGGPIVSGSIIIWAIIAGFAIAAFVCLYNRLLIGRFVSYLIRGGADLPEKALPLSASGVSNFFIRRALSSNSLLSKLVITEDTDKADIMKRRYYIPEKNLQRAQKLYVKNGASPFSVIISFVLLIILAAIAYIALPELIQMAENFAAMIKGGSN